MGPSTRVASITTDLAFFRPHANGTSLYCIFCAFFFVPILNQTRGLCSGMTLQYTGSRDLRQVDRSLRSICKPRLWRIEMFTMTSRGCALRHGSDRFRVAVGRFWPSTRLFRKHVVSQSCLLSLKSSNDPRPGGKSCVLENPIDESFEAARLFTAVSDNIEWKQLLGKNM